MPVLRGTIRRTDFTTYDTPADSRGSCCREGLGCIGVEVSSAPAHLRLSTIGKVLLAVCDVTDMSAVVLVMHYPVAHGPYQ